MTEIMDCLFYNRSIPKLDGSPHGHDRVLMGPRIFSTFSTVHHLYYLLS